MNEEKFGWFLQIQEEISGPFSIEEVKEQIQKGLPSQSLIWGRPQKSWKHPEAWLNDLPQMLATPSIVREEPTWYVGQNGESYGPMYRQELIGRLKQVSSLQGVMLWNKGLKSWLPLFDFHDLMEEIGVDRRMNSRAPIRGTITVFGPTTSQLGQLQMISEGGFGALGMKSVSPGQDIQVEIKSTELGQPIRAKAEVRYKTESGYAGFKFTQISMEAKATLIDYVRRTLATTAVTSSHSNSNSNSNFTKPQAA